ncbi:fluoroacetate dehalogenase [Methylobacterium sp. Leaf99]|uniref:alpha/beta fold hydrolase n=1 Tax=Methylobacterium sp. Leaf99 TaxID=1736251 RepID=UPI0006FFF614|nr:alpha/beta hydrolase [Methylobacterium sp. Leaf99]KQP11066.1 fluoroacetate dehalogenase [Methylobacterium sp. Leaf99]
MTTDLFPGFSAPWIDIPAGRFFARIGGPEDAPPVLLLHGFPQTHACWHRIAPALAETHRVICLDLKGYGWSAAPGGDAAHGAYAKRTLARDVVAVMEHLGHVHFAVVGHDRGARVGYRLALDEPGRVARLALLDILPTLVQWERIEASSGSAHWKNLARPAPAPENEIGRDPDGYFEGLLRDWSNAKSLDAFAPAALALYRQGWTVPERIHAMCEDYRAGATRDREADLADLAAQRTIACPTLILAGDGYLDRSAETPLTAWRRTFAPNATAVDLVSGHFPAEENPEGTLQALRVFLAA